MCGITGIIGKSDLSEKLISKVNASVNSLQHRGPDNQSVVSGQDWALGHSRLSIIDISPSANQPMQSSDGNYIIVFNGEIYNHLEIRRELKSVGVNFKTTSDTETLLEAYIHLGSRVLSKLNGFFSFCIYDKRKDEFFLARDRFGIKPLIYTIQNDFIAFASEIKAILQYPIIKEIDQEALGTYLQYSYIPAPRTIYRHINKLEPGKSLLIDSKRQLTVGDYYELPSEEVNDQMSFDEAATHVRELTYEAVKKRLIADVPLGTFLSGGVDSSVVSFCANQVKPVDTFSIGFKDEPMFDESKYAREVAAFLNTRHHQIEISNDDLLETQLMAEKALDEPFADSSAIAVNALSRFTRNHVIVTLSGDGADELFSGYNKHEALFRSMNGGLSTGLLKTAAPILKNLKGSRDSKLGNLARKAEKFDQGLKLNLTDRYASWAKFTSPDVARKLLRQFTEINQSELVGELHTFNDILRNDFRLVLQNDMLRKVDSMSMLNSLEVRTPFLDHVLVDFVFGLPSEYKVNSSGRKLLLKAAFKNDLPSSVFERKKHGFEVPLSQWFEGPLKSKIDTLLLDRERINDQGIFNFEAVHSICRESKRNRDTIWALLQFQIWYFGHYQ